MTIKYQILTGDNRLTLKTIPDNSIDAIVTDPPYGIDFLGKSWDANTGALETYQECLRVLKPGGHILAFSAARTYHHLAVTLEQAGFEIRDQIMWIYSSGFPKSQDIGKSIDRQSGQAAHKAELAEVKAILKQLYSDSGKSTAEISRECGFNAGGYLKTDFKDKGWANNLPKDDKWIKLKSVLGCGDDYDDYFVTTPQVKIGEKLSGCFGDEQRYTIGASGASVVDITQSQTDDGRQWAGWGTALKPAHEPIALARKPIKLSIARNCQAHGVGALNIDATRIPYESAKDLNTYLNNIAGPMERSTIPEGTNIGMHEGKTGFKAQKGKVKRPAAGKRTASFHQATGGGETQPGGDGSGEWTHNEAGRFPSNVIGEIAEPYQKYFYSPKVSRKERHIGFDEVPDPLANYAQGDVKNHPLWDPSIGTNVQRLKHKILEHNKTLGQAHEVQGPVGNNHPTVKPIELMKYLIRLITPAGGTVLDPFNGSGSTGCAAVELGHPYIGCELDPAYVEIAQRRIEAWYADANPTLFNRLFDRE
jgi:DNA modification methylase